jgi:hypothetical protein
VVTFIKYLLLTFLPGFYRGIVGDVEWVWPGIKTQLFGVPFTLAIIGNSLADGGLAFTLANYTSIILGECINFPLQRNVTFRSKRIYANSARKISQKSSLRQNICRC